MLWLTAVLFLLVPLAQAQQIEHQLVRRMVVFPIQVDASLSGPADEAWWQVREEITKSRRFLVASKQFLVKNDAFQARGALEPADAIILGKLLDAHALVASQLKDRVLNMVVYDGTYGFPLWQKSLKLHPSLPVADQLQSSAQKLIDDFIAAVPYQGYQIVDPLIGMPVYEEGDVKLAQIDVGLASSVQIGDVVQWIKVVVVNLNPIFQSGAKITVYAEGRVIKIDQGVATAEIVRASKLDAIKEYSLVRIPREMEHLQGTMALKDTIKTTLGAELIAPEESQMEVLTKERRPLVTTVSFLGSIAAFLLLAF